MFWVMLNNYQMLVMFLLLDIEIQRELRDLLESMKFSTFALSFLYLPGIEQLRELIPERKNSGNSGHLGKNLKSIGLERGVVLADFIYLL